MAIWKGRGRVSNRSGDVSDEDNAHDMGREKMNGYCVRSQGTHLVTNEIMTVDDSIINGQYSMRLRLRSERANTV